MAYAPPIDLVLVRHGESEGNIAQDQSKLGDDSLWEKENFKNRHTSQYRLTDLGRKQAQTAGDYIRKHITKKFDRYYCSEYIRAMETASLLGMNAARWFVDFYLRERDKGLLGGVSEMQRKEQEVYSKVMQDQERDAFYWAPPGGESIASACLRVDRVMDILKTSCSGFKVLVVCHGNIMRAFRVRIERMSTRRFAEIEESTDYRDKIWNCQIIHYTRRDPVTGDVGPAFNWVRSICPWDTSLSWNVWQPIHRPSYTTEELASAVARIPQLINNDDFVRASSDEIRKKRRLLTAPSTAEKGKEDETDDPTEESHHGQLSTQEGSETNEARERQPERGEESGSSSSSSIGSKRQRDDSSAFLYVP